MDYNHYYPSPPVATGQHGGPQVQPPPPLPGHNQMIHGAPIRQAMPPGPQASHQQQQMQHLGHISQQQQQQPQHPGYHQVQQHGPAVVPHSGSPHSGSTHSGSTHSGSPHSGSPHLQQQQQQHHLVGPPQQQHHVHPQSPHHHLAAGPPLHMQPQQQQQQLNQMIRPPMGPSIISMSQQSGLQQHHHHQQQQNFFNSAPQTNLHHYPSPLDHNQHPLSTHHQTQPQPQPHHHLQHHQPPPPPPPPQHQQPSHLNHHISPQPQLVPTPQPQPPPPTPQHLPYHQHHYHVQPQQLSAEKGSSSYFPGILQTEFRIVELNRRLQCRPNNPYDDSVWWERLASEFFEDDASLTIRVQDDKPIDYTIGRTLIPKFFRTYFDGGVTDLSINLRNPKEACLNPQLITLDCDQAFIITNNIFRHPALATTQSAVVHTEGRLILDFVSNSYDTLTIKSWKFYTKSCREYIDRSMTAMGLPKSYLIEPVTRQGLTKSTISYLRMCMIMKSMQDIMSQHKQTKIDPRTCLKQFLYDRYKFTSDDSRTGTNKRRKRKSAASPSTTITASKKKSKATLNNSISNGSLNDNLLISPVATQSFSLASQDVMVVGEPSIMGSDFSDNNERMITSRIENDNCSSSNKLTCNTNGTGAENTNSSSPKLNISQSKQVSPPISQSLSQQVQVEESSNKTSVIKQKLEESPAEDLEKRQENAEEPKLVENNNVQSISANEKTPLADSKEQGVQISEIKEEISPEVETKKVLETVEDAKPSLQATTDVATHSETKTFQPDLKEEPKKKIVPPKQVSEESLEKENNNSAFNEETHLMNSIATQNENHFNNNNNNNSSSNMNSIPENREDTCRSSSCDSIVSKLPPNSDSRTTLTSNGANNKQNRRRSSERKEVLLEGQMRHDDFVVDKRDLKCEHPSLWRIKNNNLLQLFAFNRDNGYYEMTHQYAGWNEDISKDYVAVDVKMTQHSKNQITVKQFLLNFQNLKEADTFYDLHFSIYLQILISTILDPKFWEGLEQEQEHHDHFSTSRRIIEDKTKRYKIKLSNNLKLSETSLKNVEKYPNLLIKPLTKKEEKEQLCRACNTSTSTHIVSFGNRSYDLHSYKSVKVTNELSKPNEDKDFNIKLCDHCLEIVKLYSEIHHIGWKFYNIAREKVELHRTKGKPMHLIVKECTEDRDWMLSMYDERDALWSRVENLD